MIPTRLHQTYMNHKFGGFITNGRYVVAVVYALDSVTKHRLCDIEGLSDDQWQTPHLNTNLKWKMLSNTTANSIFHQYCNTIDKPYTIPLATKRYNTATSLPLEDTVSKYDLYSQTPSTLSDNYSWTYSLFRWDFLSDREVYYIQPRIGLKTAQFDVYVLPVAGVEIEI